MNRLGYMLDPQGILDHYEGDESTAGSAVRKMTRDQLERLSDRLHGDDYLWEAYEEALERNLDYILARS